MVSDMLIVLMIPVAIAMAMLVSCSQESKRDSQQELASLSKQVGYCTAIRDNSLAIPEQCKEDAVKSRDERLSHEFGVR